LAISDALTQATGAALPTASRADVRFSAGYKPPVDLRVDRAGVAVSDDRRLTHQTGGFHDVASNAIQPIPMRTKTIDSATAACCLRSSCFIRTEKPR